MTIEEQLANAVKRIELQEYLAYLVASKQVHSEIRDGYVVYWYDEDCVEAYNALDPYCA